MKQLITDEEYERIKELLPGKKGDPGRSGADNRLFVEGVLYVVKTGIPWRYLPKEYGKWNSVWRRFKRLSLKGIWDKIFEEIKPKQRRKREEVIFLIDSTTAKVHQEGTRYFKKVQKKRIK